MSIYLDTILMEVPRLLGLLDKNPNSPTFGCFDRQYWHYSVMDFPCARYQEAALTLTFIYTLDIPGNVYFKNPYILLWIDGAVRFWEKIQRKNGSFDEWYPNESSFVATAFTSYTISEVLLILGKEISSYESIIESLEKAGDWLIKNDDFTACNQEAGAVAGLYNIYLITSKEKYMSSARKKLERLAQKQDKEGWFPEYGGPDIGYLSLAIDYLCKYYKRSKDEKAKEIVDRALNFIVYFSHPDGTFGGEYGSRNTKYIIPSGIEYSSSWNESARRIAYSLRRSLTEMKTIGPYSLDDRYLSYIGYTYIQAHIDLYSGELEEPVYNCNFSRFLPDSGIFVFSNESFYLVSNLRKGGIFKLSFKGKKTSVLDSGIVLHIDGRYYTSGWLNPEGTIEFEENRVKWESNALKLSFILMSPSKTILSRLFQLTLGRISKLNLIVKSILRRLLITYKKKSRVGVIRIIKIEPEKITVEDEINSPDVIEKIILGMENPYIYIPSSRYFQIQEIKGYQNTISPNSNRVRILREYDAQGEEKLNYQSL